MLHWSNVPNAVRPQELSLFKNSHSWSHKCAGILNLICKTCDLIRIGWFFARVKQGLEDLFAN